MYRLDEVRELDIPVSVEFDLNQWMESEESAPSQDGPQQSDSDRRGGDSDQLTDDDFDLGPRANGRKKFDEEDEGASGESSDEDADFEFDDDEEDLGDDKDDEDDDAGFDDDEDDLDDDDDDDDDDFDDMDDDD